MRRTEDAATPVDESGPGAHLLLVGGDDVGLCEGDACALPEPSAPAAGTQDDRAQAP